MFCAPLRASLPANVTTLYDFSDWSRGWHYHAFTDFDRKSASKNVLLSISPGPSLFNCSPYCLTLKGPSCQKCIVSLVGDAFVIVLFWQGYCWLIKSTWSDNDEPINWIKKNWTNLFAQILSVRSSLSNPVIKLSWTNKVDQIKLIR